MEQIGTTAFTFSPHPTPPTPIYSQTASRVTQFITTVSTTPVRIETTTPFEEEPEDIDFDGDFLDITEENSIKGPENSNSEPVTPFNQDNTIFESVEGKTPWTSATQTTPPSTVPTTTTTAATTVFRHTTTNPTRLTTFVKSSPGVIPTAFDLLNEQRKLFDPRVPARPTFSPIQFPLDPEEQPRKFLEHEKIKKISSADIQVQAMCLDHGVNVTFTTNGEVRLHLN